MPKDELPEIQWWKKPPESGINDNTDQHPSDPSTCTGLEDPKLRTLPGSMSGDAELTPISLRHQMEWGLKIMVKLSIKIKKTIFFT